MTSSQQNKQELVPNHIDRKILNESDQHGLYTIKTPTIEHSTMLKGEKKVPITQVRCNSLIVLKDKIHTCNNIFLTLIDDLKGKNFAPMIVECPKCRTSYLIRPDIDKDGNFVPKIVIWNLNRNVSKFCKHKYLPNYDKIVMFNQ